ncbi:cobalamin biosynthesis protein CbiX [Streptomyces albus subsp. albus]|nr:cobalamin biosynthesis protein CbiX [Streptomyces albus subsp. albus]
MTSPPALLIADHGIRDEAAAEAFRAFTQELGDGQPGLPVAGGGVGPGQPSLALAAARLVEQGATRVAVVPLGLVPDGRAHGALAAALDTARERHPGVRFAQGAPVGTHPKLLDVLERRLAAALGEGGRTPSDRAATTVLLVGAGSTDPFGNAEVHRVARLLWEGRGFAGVEAAFAALAAPDVASGLDRCARLGAQRVVVLPYLPFAGAVTDRVWQQAEGWALAYPRVRVMRAEPVGAAEELRAAVLERYAEAAAVLARQDAEAAAAFAPQDAAGAGAPAAGPVPGEGRG